MNWSFISWFSMGLVFFIGVFVGLFYKGVNDVI